MIYIYIFIYLFTLFNYFEKMSKFNFKSIKSNKINAYLKEIFNKNERID